MGAMILLLVKTVFSILAVMDPIGAIPIFIGITPHNTEDERRRMVTRACVVTCVVLLFFGFTRTWLFEFFGFTLGAFRLAGGLVLLILAFDMLNAKEAGSKNSTEEADEGYAKDDISITPLAIPLLAGPATITSVILGFGEAPDWQHSAVVWASIIVACIICWVTLSASSYLSRILGATGIKFVTRTMGMILASIAIQFCADGIKDLFPVIKGAIGA